MKESISKKLASLSERIVELDRLLSVPEVVNDMDSYRKITREHADISPVVALFSEYKKSEDDVAAAQEMGKDLEMREFAEEEIKAGRARLEQIEIVFGFFVIAEECHNRRNISVFTGDFAITVHIVDHFGYR